MQKGSNRKQTTGVTIPEILRRHILTPFNAFNFAIGLCILAVGAYKNLLYLFVIVANILIGIVQDIRSKRIVDKLSLLNAPSVTVMRNGEAVTVPPEELQSGETFCLKRGDQICADATVLSGEIRVNEALLTGESAQIQKNAGNALLSGSFVTAGTCTARADKVGEDCYAASVTREAKKAKRNNSVILSSLNKIVRFTSFFIVPLGAVLFYTSYKVNGYALSDSVVTTSAALLGLLPKGLVLLTSVSLAVGVIRLGKKNTLVQELYGIETLARVDVLCMDKTGTLTEGAMRADRLIPLLGDAVSEKDERAMAAFLGAFEEESAVLSALRARFRGENTEAPAAVAAFSSERAWSGASFPSLGSYYLGAPERMPFAVPESVKKAQAEGAQVLVFARANEWCEKALPDVLTPLFAVCLEDAVRPEAMKTLRYFEEQGVRLMIFSGDSAMATESIANRAGLAGRALNASALREQSDYNEAVREYSLFGSVLPEQKRELVSALQRQGHTVGFLGDGVNDVLAIREADCGAAMASGCDAAKRVAKLVLMDSSFTSLPDVVLEGRRVINNIRRVAPFFLTKTCYSFLLSLICALTGAQYPFTAFQISLYSIVLEALPAMILTFLPNSSRIEGDIVRDAIRRALPFALAVAAGVSLILFVLVKLPGLASISAWAPFAWLCLVGASLVVRVMLTGRH